MGLFTMIPSQKGNWFLKAWASVAPKAPRSGCADSFGCVLRIQASPVAAGAGPTLLHLCSPTFPALA